MEPDETSRREAVRTENVDPDALRDIVQVVTAIAQGNFTLKLPETGAGDIGELQRTLNGLVDRTSWFATEVTRIAREIGVEGRFGGQAEVPGITGTWADMVRAVNSMSASLTDQVRDMSRVAAALADGGAPLKVTVDAQGETQLLKDYLNRLAER
jgi:HAMP domain-containing protein